MNPLRAIIPALLFTAASGGAAQDNRLADLVEIDRLVVEFSGQPAGSSQPVDRRLRLAACPERLALAWHGSRRDTVRVACPQPGGWQLFVSLRDNRTAELAAAKVVGKGDPVTIRMAGRGFAVTMSGQALEDGHAAQWIRVRPAGARAPLLGRVEGAGLVSIALP